MKATTKYIITIDEPCHEKWSGMTATASGKFCHSCVKSVIDFTKLSDSQINAILEKSQGKELCGRFDSKQLNKIMTQTHAEKSNPALYKILAGLLLLTAVENGMAQTTPDQPQTENVRRESYALGKFAMNVVKGTVFDENGKPVNGAKITLEGATPKAISDKDGHFTITAEIGTVLKISKKGFPALMLSVNASQMSIQFRSNKAPKVKPTSEMIMGGMGVQIVKSKRFLSKK